MLWNDPSTNSIILRYRERRSKVNGETDRDTDRDTDGDTDREK